VITSLSTGIQHRFTIHHLPFTTLPFFSPVESYVYGMVLVALSGGLATIKPVSNFSGVL